MTLLELLHLLRKHLKLVVALPIICAIVTAIVAWGFLPNTYTSTVSMYVLTQSATSSDSGSVSNNDLSASQMLTNDVATLIESDRIKTDTANSLNLPSLSGFDIDVTSSTTTRVITVSVTGESAQSAADVANGLAATVNNVAQEVMGVESINVIDEANVPTSPSGPARTLYTAVAFLAGLFVAIAIVVIMDMTNTRVRNDEDIEELLGIPVIGRIPVIKE